MCWVFLSNPHADHLFENGANRIQILDAGGTLPIRSHLRICLQLVGRKENTTNHRSTSHPQHGVVGTRLVGRSSGEGSCLDRALQRFNFVYSTHHIFSTQRTRTAMITIETKALARTECFVGQINRHSNETQRLQVEVRVRVMRLWK